MMTTKESIPRKRLGILGAEMRRARHVRRHLLTKLFAGSATVQLRLDSRQPHAGMTVGGIPIVQTLLSLAAYILRFYRFHVGAGDDDCSCVVCGYFHDADLCFAFDGGKSCREALHVAENPEERLADDTDPCPDIQSHLFAFGFLSGMMISGRMTPARI